MHEWLGQVFIDSVFRLLAQLRLLEWLKFVFSLVCVIKCLMILMESYYYYPLSISFLYVLSPHVVHKGIQENKCGGDTPRQQDEIRLRKSRNSESNGPTTTLTKVGPKWAREWAAQPPTWADRPILALPHLALHPWSGLRPICSIFTCIAFSFEPN